MKMFRIAALLAVSSLATGCASIVSGTNQSLSVETRNKGQKVVSANCKLENDKGAWYVTTPGSVTVNRSYKDLNVKCEKDGLTPGLMSVKSTTKGMAFGNILLGGVIGAGVDAATGAAYDYPNMFAVEMGETTVYAPPVEPQAPGAQAAATPSVK